MGETRHASDSLDDVITLLMKRIKEDLKDLPPIGIVVMGKSGVGKSTLINAMFRGNIAKTGAGKPITQRIMKYPKDGRYPISIYDTPGFELSEKQRDAEA